VADIPEAISDVPAAGADYLESDRNHYFTGQFLTARDVTRDQTYHVSRLRLHQRLLHGWGVVCGLGVRPRTADVPPGCAGFSAEVAPGLALDCYGRDLILPQTKYLDLRRLPDESALPNLPCDDGAAGGDPPDAPFLLCAAFTARGAEEVPVLYADGRPAATNWNRLHESVSFVRRARVERECWPDLWAHPHGLTFPDGCAHPPAGEHCLTPGCACGATVPLALVVPDKDGTGVVTGYKVHTAGRRTIPRPPLPQDLTHVRHTSWTHGVPMQLCHLRDHWHWALRVHLDRPLAEHPGPGRGVNPHTFLVHVPDPDDPRRLLRLPGHAYAAEENLAAEFRIIHDHHLHHLIERWRHHNITPTVGVTLRCDFLPDCNGRAVDGNFIAAHFPTGDGVPGGTFESWFDLTL
jgi:hypothetical protein